MQLNETTISIHPPEKGMQFIEAPQCAIGTPVSPGTGGFQKWRYPNSSMVLFRENPYENPMDGWMRTGGTPMTQEATICGHVDIYSGWWFQHLWKILTSQLG